MKYLGFVVLGILIFIAVIVIPELAQHAHHVGH